MLRAAPVVLVAVITLLSAAVPFPATKKERVVDDYFGDKVVDDYRWLENGDDPEVQAWSDAQNTRARTVLDALPGRTLLEKRLDFLMSWESPAYQHMWVRGGKVFAQKQQPPKQQPFVVVIDALDDPKSERVLVDPSAIDKTGGTSIDFVEPSPDGRFVAVSLSSGGSEMGDVHIYDVKTGKERTGDVCRRAHTGTAGGSLAWAKDSEGFWWTPHPGPNEVKADDVGFFQQVAFHKLGASAPAAPPAGAAAGKKGEPASTATKDPIALGGADLPRIAENFLQASEDGRFVLDHVQKGDGGEYELWMLDTQAAEPRFKKIAGYADKVVAVRFGLDGSLWLLSRKDAGRGKIQRMSSEAASVNAAKTIVAESPASIDAFEVTESRIFVVEQDGGPSKLPVYDFSGRRLLDVEILPVSSVGEVVRLPNDTVLFSNQSFVRPIAWFVGGADGKVQKTPYAMLPPVEMADIQVQRRFAISKDGARVPMTLLFPPSVNLKKLDGENPALLSGYGGFSIPITPTFSKASRAWLEQGGVLVIANIRGGTEFGEVWHQQGYKTKKQNVFNDFIACAELLIKDKVTKPARLAIRGGSNGGLLMGAMITQRPDLVKAVVAEVGYFDMLRYETRPNGAFNNTEYGTVANKEEYTALRAYSPYHNIKDGGTTYPPTLFMTGKNDPRVDPLHSRKMVARLQSVSSEALLRTSASTGHGGGTPLSAKIAEQVDAYSFLFSQLGVTVREIK